MSREEEVKQEASLPVQSRVDVRSLASITMAWEDQGYVPRTMSELISVGVEMLLGVMRNSGKVRREVQSVSEAVEYLQRAGISVGKKGSRKLQHAIMFEGMRDEGVNPAEYAPVQYRVLHKEGSVIPVGRIDSKYMFSDEEKTKVNDLAKQAMTTYNKLYGKEDGMSEEEARERIKQLKREGRIEEEEEGKLVAHVKASEEELRMRERKEKDYLEALKHSRPDVSKVVSE